jgi:hypothetical protein
LETVLTDWNVICLHLLSPSMNSLLHVNTLLVSLPDDLIISLLAGGFLHLEHQLIVRDRSITSLVVCVPLDSELGVNLFSLISTIRIVFLVEEWGLLLFLLFEIVDDKTPDKVGLVASCAQLSLEALSLEAVDGFLVVILHVENHKVRLICDSDANV